jgi:hypothetical protein
LNKKIFLRIFVSCTFGVVAGLLFFHMQPTRNNYSAMIIIGRIAGVTIEPIPTVLQRIVTSANEKIRCSEGLQYSGFRNISD